LERHLLALRDRCHHTLTARECGILNTLISGAGGSEGTGPAQAHTSA
jgi:hypothetical protein